MHEPMNLLKPQEWNSMTLQQRIDYLNSRDVRTRSEVVVDGSARVGESTPTRKYQGLTGDLCVEGWYEDEERVRTAAQTFKRKFSDA